MLNGEKLTNTKSSIFAEKTLKEKQLDIINKTNPMLDDYHTGIRTIVDIKTLEESINDPEWNEYDEYNPDYTKSMAQQAIETGKVTVYSSNQIKNGVFVSPSKMEAESYSGNGKVYSKEVNTNDIAWIDPTQGQYAEIPNELPKTIEINGVQRSTTNSNGKPIHSTEEGIRNFWKWFGDSKVVDESGRPLVVFHGTNAKFNKFKEDYPDNPKLKAGWWFTNNKELAKEYGNVKQVYIKSINPVNNNNLRDTYSENGFDSYIYTPSGKNNMDSNFNINVESPTQIKSATGNNGEFDGSKPDIRFQIIGEQGAAALDKAEEATTRLDNLRVAKEMEKGGKERKVLFVDSDGKNIVYDDGNYRIAVDDTEKANYITLWHKEEVKGKEYWAKRGYLSSYKTNQNSVDNGEYKGKYLSIYSVEIDKKNRGSGYGKKLYKVLEDFAADDVKGIYSYLPNRVNKREVPTIYKRMNAKVVDGDHQFVNFKKQSFTPAEIRLATGWEKGVDGLWRYEVPDVKLKPTEESITNAEKLHNGKSIDLVNFVDGKELFRAYPALRWVKVKFDKSMSFAGSYNKLKGDGAFGEIRINPNNHSNDNYLLSTLIHEIQHAIQEIEGFAKGGSLNSVALESHLSKNGFKTVAELNSAVDDLQKRYKQVYNEWYNKAFGKRYKGQKAETSLLLKNWNELEKQIKDLKETEYDTREVYETYKRLSGEVESRNAETRINLTDEERRTKLLSETADVAPEDQIIIQDGLGVSQSIQPTPDPKPKFQETGHETETMAEYATRINEYNGKTKTYVTENLKSSKRRSDLKQIEILLTRTKDKSAELRKVKNYIEKNLQDDMERMDAKPEYERLIAKLDNGITTRDVNKLIRLIDTVISNSEEGKFTKMLDKLMDSKTVKINDKLVSEAKMVGATIREDLEYINTYKGMDETAIEKRINEIYDEYIEENQGNDADTEMTEEQLHELQNLEILKKIAVRNVAMK
ncbi:MAG TPA: hypothetical protein DCS19_05530, partial [Flavobacterium sp.]|nr:hypothetical protein [Flavobacterium sp.]